MIPNKVTKSEIKNEWYSEYPVYTVRKAILNVTERIGINKKTAKWIDKIEIIEIIKELGLPGQFTSDDWYDYIDDPTLYNPNNIKEIKVEL